MKNELKFKKISIIYFSNCYKKVLKKLTIISILNINYTNIAIKIKNSFYLNCKV